MFYLEVLSDQTISLLTVSDNTFFFKNLNFPLYHYLTPQRYAVDLLSRPHRFSLLLSPQSPVVSVGFARFHPNLVVGGTYSGQIVLWDNRSHRRTPVQRTPLSAAAHTVRLEPSIGTSQVFVVCHLIFLVYNILCLSMYLSTTLHATSHEASTRIYTGSGKPYDITKKYC